ncbi:MAG TPA: ABC transporter ATP-binding protein [Bauldia sp.]|nr:ABC transporter ATP-binding protein [Bauldia sp.]
MARIELVGLEKAWGSVTAVDDVNLAVEDGEFVALLGPSGCGKTTTLFMLAGIYKPTAGRLLFDGHEVNDVEAKDRNIGIVFQSYALYPHMTVRDNIAFPLRFKSTSQAERQRRVEEAAALVRVQELLDRRPSQLSGGQQQRVALARALVKQPQLLLLDEPLSNLDATLRLTMRSEIKQLQAKLGLTTILVTHDQLEATTMADRIVCMNKGRIEQVDGPDDLYARPNSLFVAGFIGAPPINLLPGVAGPAGVSVGEASLALSGKAAGPVTLGIRPENITVGGPLPADVVQIEPMGREVLYLLRTTMGEIKALEAGTVARWHIGERPGITFQPDATLLFDEAGRRVAGANVAIRNQ